VELVETSRWRVKFMTDYTYTVIRLLSHLDLRRQYYWRTELTPDFVPLVAVHRLEEMGDDRLYVYRHTVTVSSGFVSSVLLTNWMTERVDILRSFCISDKSISSLFLNKNISFTYLIRFIVIYDTLSIVSCSPLLYCHTVLTANHEWSEVCQRTVEKVSVSLDLFATTATSKFKVYVIHTVLHRSERD